MDAHDLSRIRDSVLGARLEGGSLKGYDWAIITFPQTSIHHETRCLWRLVVFAQGDLAFFSLDLERDILGEFCLSLVSEGRHQIVYRYGAAPTFEAFRQRALEEAASFIERPLPVGETSPSSPRSGVHSARTKARRH